MTRTLLWATLLTLASCAIAPPRPEPPAPPPPIPLAAQLAALDPDDGLQQVVLILGTDDDLFSGEVDVQQYYGGCLALWSEEFRDVFDGDYVLFLSHGTSHGGRWVCEYGPPFYFSLNFITRDIRNMLGPRNAEVPIVLLVCNPWGYEITHDDRVWYAKHNIFLLPDSAMEAWGGSNRRDLLPCGEVVVGDVSDFVRGTKP